MHYMADDALLDQQKALKARVDATRADAAQLRHELGEAFASGATERGITRDRAIREKAAADHAVAAADAQITSLTATAATTRKDLAESEAAIVAAEVDGRGDAPEVQELREHADGFRHMVAEYDTRVGAAALDAATAREHADDAERAVRTAASEYDAHYDAVGAADKQIDLIEQRADLIEQARMKLVEIEVMYGDPPAGTDMAKWASDQAALRVEADDLVKQAEAITVDRSIIAVVVPTADDLPTTGGALPTNDTDLMDPNAEATGDAAAMSVDGDALGLDLVGDDTDAADSAAPADPIDDTNGGSATTRDEDADMTTAVDFPEEAPEVVNSVDDLLSADGSSDTGDADFLTGATPDLADPQTTTWDPAADDSNEFSDAPMDEFSAGAVGDSSDGTSDGFGADGF